MTVASCARRRFERRAPRLVAAAALLFLALGCGGRGAARPDAAQPDAPQDAPETPITSSALFVLPGPGRGTEFFSMPFPTDLRRKADGTADLSGLPAPPKGLADAVFAAAAATPAFSPTAPAYFRFSAPLEPSSLPDVAGSLADDAAVFLIDVDPASRSRGARVPVTVRFYAEGNHYIGPNWLAVRPHPGFVLRAGGRYAAVVTSGLRAADGGAVGPMTDWTAIRGTEIPADPAAAAAQAVFAPLFATTDAQLIPRERLLAAALFTVADPGAALRAARGVARATAAPTFDAPTCYESGWGYTVCSGTYDDPQFQSGAPPFTSDGGTFVAGSDGVPKIQRSEAVRVSVTIPPGAPPAAGWPVIVCGMGTGTDYRAQIDALLGADAVALPDGKGGTVRAATLSMDPPLAGPRDPTGGDPSLTFFNINNPQASRDNVRQSVLDFVQVLRLLDQQPLVAAAALPVAGYEARFDRDKVLFFGHSEGAVAGAILLGMEPTVRAAVLSEGGADTTLGLIYRKRPVDTRGVLARILGETMVDDFHPALAVIQMVFDAADPLIYSSTILGDAASSRAPVHLALTEAVNDDWMPPESIEALATALGIPQLAPVRSAVQGIALRGLVPVSSPLGGNLSSSSGAVTAALMQYAPASDMPHWFLIDDRDARKPFLTFYGTFVADGVPTIPSL